MFTGIIAGLEGLSGCTVFLKYRIMYFIFVEIGNIAVLVAVRGV
jgi:hypothetical protein